MLPQLGSVLAWADRAACAGIDLDYMFTEGTAAHQAAKVCTGCPVKTECLEYALVNRMDYGVWGGLTARQRRKLLKETR